MSIITPGLSDVLLQNVCIG